jgi:hypothetical protein
MDGTLDLGKCRDIRVHIHILEEVSYLTQRRDMGGTTRSMAQPNRAVHVSA